MKKPTVLETLSKKPKWKIDRLPKHLTEAFGQNGFSVAINCSDLTVIEVSDCVDDGIAPPIKMLIEQFYTYTEYVPETDGIRIIGYSFEGCRLESECNTLTTYSNEHLLSIYRRCDRWINISGILIFDWHVCTIEEKISELIENPDGFFSLR